MHVFQALTRVVPEAEDALEKVARFLADELDIAARRSRLTLVKGA